MLDKIKTELLQKLSQYFPLAEIEVEEKRSIILEIRAVLNKNTFIEVYVNIFTEKKSFSLISNKIRIMGYDNYKFWHSHPLDNPNNHLACEEPSLDLIFSKFKEGIKG